MEEYYEHPIFGRLTDEEDSGIPCYNIPPYSLTVPKELVSERKLEEPDKEWLFDTDFKIE